MAESKKILYGLTTTPKSDWREKVEEIRELNIKEAALLPTCLRIEERKELYSLLDSIGFESAPYVHMRDDFTESEVEFLMSRFKTKVFSCHADATGFALLDLLAKYASLIYVENPVNLGKESFFNVETFNRHQVIGICLDASHYWMVKSKNRQGYRAVNDMLSRYPVGITHISAIHGGKTLGLFNTIHDEHFLETLTQLDYLRGIPAKYFGKYIVMELENSITEQIEIEKYLKMILKDKI